MPEDSFTIENLHFGVIGRDGSYEDVGEVVESVPFVVDKEESSSKSYFREALADHTGTLTLKVPWWQVNTLAKVMGYRAPYLVARLRRGGKSHKGKARLTCHAT